MQANPEDSIVRPAPQAEDRSLDDLLRPQSFDDFVGQKRLKDNLRIYIEAARRRGESLDHALFSGPPGLGKTTLAHIVAHEMGVDLKCTTGPAIERPGDLAGLLTNLSEGDVLFIDEIHRLGTVVEEYLYAAMERFTIHILIDQGPSARSVTIPIPRFTLIGATTRDGLLAAPFRSRFGVRERIDYYPPEELLAIIKRSAAKLNVPIEETAARLMAERARGTPRIANRFVRRIRDVAEVIGSGVIDESAAREGLARLGIDEHGLDELDRRILSILMDHHRTAVGLKTIAVAVGEEEDTIQEVCEPYLIRCGYIRKTPRGRVATDRAYRGYRPDHRPEGDDKVQGELF